MYKIIIDTKFKIFSVTLSGFLEDKDGEKFILELQEKISSIDTSEYILYINLEKIKLRPKNLSHLEYINANDFFNRPNKSIEIMSKAIFKDRYVTLSKAPILNTEYEKNTKKYESMKSIKIISSYDELIKIVKDYT